MEASTPAPALPLDETSSLEHTSSVHELSALETIRCWNREQVRQICRDFPETVRIRASHPDLPGEDFVNINKALLSRLSPYYRAAFHRGFCESSKEILDMELWPADMHAFRTWLRDGRLTFRWDRLLPEQLVRIYVFADYYDFPALRRTIMSTLVLDKYGDKAFQRLLIVQFEGYISQLPRISPLYQWLAAVWARHIFSYVGPEPPQAHQLKWLMPQDFRDLAHTIRSDRRHFEVCRCCHNPCDFHEHQSVQEWERTCHTLDEKIRKPDPSTYRK